MQVLLVFGGRSVEHEVSIRSAASIYEVLRTTNHKVFCAGIDYDGQWYSQNMVNFFKEIHEHHVPMIGPKEGEPIWMNRVNGKTSLFRKNNSVVFTPDVVFPITHGTYGEDGSLQGLFQQMDIPFVGCDVCASACAMDKDLTKRLLRDAGIAVTPWQTIPLRHRDEYTYTQMQEKLGEKLFIKPASVGSSVGASLAINKEEYEHGLDLAFRFDDKVLIEECIVGREIEFAVLGGNSDINVSVAGEICPDTEFYGYEDKYILNSTKLIIPPEVSLGVLNEGRGLAVKAYEALGCEGLSRVDFFLKNESIWLVNEINTLPGFTSISMYPKLWEATGKTTVTLLEELMQHAINRHNSQKRWQIRRGG